MWNDQRLKKEVSEVDDKDREAVELDLLDTLKVDNFDFLAAPQIGIPKKCLAINHEFLNDERIKRPICLYNPVLVTSKSQADFFQKCHSVPHFGSCIKRFCECFIKGESMLGEVELKFTGEKAAELQKAYDFFYNKSILSRVSNLKRKIYLKSISRSVIRKKRKKMLELEESKSQDRNGFRKKRKKKK